MKYRLFPKLFILCATILFAWLPPGSTQAAKAEQSVPATTSDTSRLTLMRNILFVRLTKGFYEIQEIFMFQNRGKKTIVSKHGSPTLRLVLPRSNNIRSPDAELSAPFQGVRRKNVRLSGAEVIITEPIPPGIKLVGLFYRLADEFGGIVVDRPIAYGTSSFALLTEKGRVQTGTESFMRQRDTVKFEEKEYDSFLGSTRAGAVVRFTLKAPDSAGGLVYFYAAGGMFVLLGGGLSVWIRIRRRGDLVARMERDELLRSLVSLDDRLEQGEISAEAHQSQRGPLFESLRGMSR